MFNKIKEFFMGSKPAVEATQEVPLTAADAAIKNIKETTAAVDAKVEVTAVKEKPWTENSPAPIATTTRKKPQTTKATTTAPRKRKPAPK